MSDKPALHLVGMVRVSPALLRRAALILHQEARQLRENHTIPGTGTFENRLAGLDYRRYKRTAAALDEAAMGPLA